MATHSTFLTRKIPCGEEPDGLQSMRSQNVRDKQATEYTYTLKRLSLFGISSRR